MTLRSITLALLLALSGCRNLLRVEAGIGPGIGADVHVSGLVHTGLLATAVLGGGTVYGRTGGLGSGAVTIPFFHAQTAFLSEARYHHTNLGLLPPLTAGVTGTGELNAHPWAFEVTLALVLVTIRLGLDPIGALIEGEPPAPLPRPPPLPPSERELDRDADPRELREDLAQAVGVYAVRTGPGLASDRSLRRARIRRAMAACAERGAPVSTNDLVRWARRLLDGPEARARAEEVARELDPFSRPPLNAAGERDEYSRRPTPAERARSARAFLSHAVGLYASWGEPCLDPSWRGRRAELRTTIQAAIAACEDQGDVIDLFQLAAWAHDTLRRHRWCDPTLEADDVARELLPPPSPDRRVARPDPWLHRPERRLERDASASRARAFLAEAVSEYALGTGAAFEVERLERKDRIQRAAWVCSNAGEPVTIDELAAWARSRLEGEDADAWAATIARELARHCGVTLRTIRIEER